MTEREAMLVRAVVAAGLVGAVAWGYVRLVSARDAAAVAADSLVECRQLASQIEARRVPGVVVEGVGEPRANELVKRIESAAKEAGLPDAGIERIQPGVARRTGDSGGGDNTLMEKPTDVQLRDVTLRELFTFLHTLTTSGGTGRPGLQLKEIRLTAPSPGDTGDRWAVEGTLTYLVRAPADNGRVQ